MPTVAGGEPQRRRGLVRALLDVELVELDLAAGVRSSGRASGAEREREEAEAEPLRARSQDDVDDR